MMNIRLEGVSVVGLHKQDIVSFGICHRENS